MRAGSLFLLFVAVVALGCSAPAPAAPVAAPATAPRATAPAATGGPTSGTASGSTSGATAVASEPRALREAKIGSVSPLTGAPIHIAEQRGYFAAVGLKPDIVRLQSGADAIPALATGQIDVGSAITPTVALLNAVQRGLELKVVAASGSATNERWGSGFAVGGTLAAAPGSLRDFNLPVRVAATGEGTLPNAMTVLLARRDGLPVSDLHFVSIGLPDMNAALANGSVDVAATTEPFVRFGEQNGTVKRWLSYGEITPGMPNVTVGTIMYGANFLGEREVGERFLEAWLRGARDWDDAILSGRDLDELMAIVSGPTRTTPETIALLRQSGTLTLMQPDGLVDTAAWAEAVEVWKSQGLIGEFNAQQLVDPTFAERVVARLGPYRPR